jgi:[protein-PII] uridylyltransferase
VWGDWKAALIGDLVRRCRLLMGGEPELEPEPIAPELLAVAEDGAVHVDMKPGEVPHTYEITMIAPDRRGLLSKAAGTLALNSLSVHSASVNSAALPAGASAINTFVVSPQFGEPPAPELLRQQFIQALNGGLDVIAALEKRDQEANQYGTGRVGEHNAAVPAAPVAPPLIRWHDAQQPDRRLVEVRSTDRTGLLAILTAVFERAGADIDWAKITTLGAAAIDVFAISAPASEAACEELERNLYAVLPAPPPAPPVQEAG